MYVKQTQAVKNLTTIFVHSERHYVTFMCSLLKICYVTKTKKKNLSLKLKRKKRKEFLRLAISDRRTGVALYVVEFS